MKFLITVATSLILASSLRAVTVEELQAEIVLLRAQVAALAPLAAIAPYVHFDAGVENGLAGPHITFSGVNVHINNGAGQTASTNSLGNLILGFDELPSQRPFYSYSRSGSHNLIVGPQHSFYSGAWGNIVGGEQNIVQGQGGLEAGDLNTINGFCSGLVGGVLNNCTGEYAVVVGGQGDQALGLCSVVLGGDDNIENAWYVTLLGGQYVNDNSASFDVVGVVTP
jgi:hypothetical protein